MNISNYLKFNAENPSTAAGDRQQRLESRRNRFDQFFDKMQSQAIADGDSEKAQKIFEVSEMVEGRLDKRLDRLEEKSGDINWRRRLDNALDERQMEAYDNDEPEKAEEIFGLSQDIANGPSSLDKGSLLEKFMTTFLGLDAEKPETAATTIGTAVTENTAALGSSTTVPVVAPSTSKAAGTV